MDLLNESIQLTPTVMVALIQQVCQCCTVRIDRTKHSGWQFWRTWCHCCACGLPASLHHRQGRWQDDRTDRSQNNRFSSICYIACWLFPLVCVYTCCLCFPYTYLHYTIAWLVPVLCVLFQGLQLQWSSVWYCMCVILFSMVSYLLDPLGIHCFSWKWWRSTCKSAKWWWIIHAFTLHFQYIFFGRPWF